LEDELIAHFDAPPVVEVVAGVTFDGLGSNTGPLLSAFWKERLKRDFPKISVQAPYLPGPEQFPAAAHPLGLQLEVMHGPFLNRLWAASEDGGELIQLQPGWFACNWRKVKKDDEYDHFGARRDAFLKWYGELSDFLARENEGRLKLTQAEVTYINHIERGTVWVDHSDFEKIFTVSLGPGGTGAGKFEQINATATFRLEHDGVTYGRLYVKLQPAFGADGRTPLYVFELTARGMVSGEDVSAVREFFDKARTGIVQTFLNLTTGEMQAEWLKK
jgi:uncharacterized protein (TIGR04255 family)